MGKIRVFDHVKFNQRMPQYNLQLRQYLKVRLYAEQLGKLIAKDRKDPIFTDENERNYFMKRVNEYKAHYKQEEKRLLIALIGFLKGQFRFEDNTIPLTFLQLVCIHFAHQLTSFYKGYVHATYTSNDEEQLKHVLKYDFNLPYQDYKWIARPVRKVQDMFEIKVDISQLLSILSAMYEAQKSAPEKVGFYRASYARSKQVTLSKMIDYFKINWQIDAAFEKRYRLLLDDIINYYCLLILKGQIANKPLSLRHKRSFERLNESLEREIHLSDARTKPGRFFNFKDTARFYQRELQYDFAIGLRVLRDQLSKWFDSRPTAISSFVYEENDPRHVFKLQPVPPKRHRLFTRPVEVPVATVDDVAHTPAGPSH